MGKEYEPDFRGQKNLIPDNLDHETRLSLIELGEILRLCWSDDTCTKESKKMWNTGNPALGQSDVTALMVQLYFLGKIVKDPDNNHFWNILDGGIEVDLSREQFSRSVIIKPSNEVTRQKMLRGDDAVKAKRYERYEILSKRVKTLFER